MAYVERRRQRRADGKLGPTKWRARWRDPAGNPRQKSFTKRAHAETFLKTLEADLVRGDYIDPQKANLPYGEWAMEWFGGLRKMGSTRRATQVGYLKNHILPTFEAIPIGQIANDPTLVREWFNELVEKPSKRSGNGAPLSPWAIRAIYGLFARSMRAAVAARLIREAPLGPDVVDLPAIERKPERFLSQDEAEFFVAGVTEGVPHLDPTWRALHYAAVWTGCRWEELAGLRRTHLDLENEELRVRTVAARASAGRYELRDVPKNDYSRRDIELPSRLVEILKFHLASVTDSELVFPNERGGIIDYGNFRERVFAPAVKKSRLERFTFHELRHTHVAWLIDADWSEYRIVRRMGWKDSRMLYTTYGHLLDKHNREGMATLEERWIEPASTLDAQSLFAE